MIAIIVIPLLCLGLAAIVGTQLSGQQRNRVLQTLIGALFLRLVLFEAVMRRVAFFSHGVAGGDCLLYQDLGSMIAQLWRFESVHFVSETEMPQLGQAALPCNVLALAEYVNGAPAPLAATAFNAFLACWTAFLVYRFICDAGAEEKNAFRVMLLVLFGPSFLYHTSDTYKDGINAFLVIGSLLNSVRLAQRFSPERLAYLGVSLAFLWFVRRYMVFMCLVPLSLGFIGVGKASLPRRLAAGVFMIAVLAGLFYSGRGVQMLETASETYTHATSANVLAYNARTGAGQGGGSGVQTSNYAEAIVYTIFAPFPWQLGSMGLQLGKIEAFIFYWFIYTVWRNRKSLWAEHRANVIMMTTFVVPATLAYAATMSNVGLIVRQRMPIVIAMAILAGIAYKKPAIRASTAQTARGTGTGMMNFPPASR